MMEIQQLDGAEISKMLSGQGQCRENQRYPYSATQNLAPIWRGIQGRFREVNCSDISPGGISFYLEYPPDFDQFLITLNYGEHQIKAWARVASFEQGNGTAPYLVRGEFTRLDR